MTEIHNFIIRISIKSVSVFKIKIKQFVKNAVTIKMYCNDTFNTLTLLCVKYDNIFRSIVCIVGYITKYRTCNSMMFGSGWFSLLAFSVMPLL